MLGVYGEEGAFLLRPVGKLAGVREWVELLERRSIHWHMHCSTVQRIQSSVEDGHANRATAQHPCTNCSVPVMMPTLPATSYRTFNTSTLCAARLRQVRYEIH